MHVRKTGNISGKGDHIILSVNQDEEVIYTLSADELIERDKKGNGVGQEMPLEEMVAKIGRG